MGLTSKFMFLLVAVSYCFFLPFYILNDHVATASVERIRGFSGYGWGSLVQDVVDSHDSSYVLSGNAYIYSHTQEKVAGYEIKRKRFHFADKCMPSLECPLIAGAFEFDANFTDADVERLVSLLDKKYGVHKRSSSSVEFAGAAEQDKHKLIWEANDGSFIQLSFTLTSPGHPDRAASSIDAELLYASRNFNTSTRVPSNYELGITQTEGELGI